MSTFHRLKRKASGNSRLFSFLTIAKLSTPELIFRAQERRAIEFFKNCQLKWAKAIDSPSHDPNPSHEIVKLASLLDRLWIRALNLADDGKGCSVSVDEKEAACTADSVHGEACTVVKEPSPLTPTNDVCATEIPASPSSTRSEKPEDVAEALLEFAETRDPQNDSRLSGSFEDLHVSNKVDDATLNGAIEGNLISNSYFNCMQMTN